MITVAFKNENSITISSINQWATGNMLKVTGLTLNDRFCVHFSHSVMSCENLALERMGKTYGDCSVIPVPNYLFTVAGTITVTFSNKTIKIPVASASKPSDYDNNCKCDVDVDRAMICELLSSGGSGSDVIELTDAEVEAIIGGE